MEPASDSDHTKGKVNMDADAAELPLEWIPRSEVTDQYGSIAEGRRTYHGYMAGSYSLPNDGEEQSRLDGQHVVWRGVLDGRLHLSPVEGPMQALDVATGTGAWAIDFGRTYTSSQVYGTDLSLVQPPAPKNVHFVLADSEDEEWLFPTLFDFVHFRSTFTCLHDVKAVLERTHEAMRPGAWVEFQEGDWGAFKSPNDTLRGTALERWSELVVEGLARTGVDHRGHTRDIRANLEETGFVKIQEERRRIPIGTWDDSSPKQIGLGKWARSVVLQAVESFRKILGFTEMSEAELDELLEQAAEDLRNPGIHCYLEAYIIYGAKKEEE